MDRHRDTRFQDILLLENHLAGSDRGFGCGLEVARLHGSDLTVAAVVPAAPGDDPLPLVPGAARCLDTLAEQWHRRLRRLAELARGQGVDARVRVLRGDPVETVEAEVVRRGHDLVMKAAEAGGRFWPWRLGRGDRHLLRGCPCSVWILHPAQGPGLRVVLAGVDVGPGRAPELNRDIVGVAGSLAGRAGTDLHLVHAWSLVGEPILASSMAGLSRPRMRGVLAATRRERRRALERLLSEAAPGQRAALELLKGDASRVILHDARRTDADVVVVGNTARTGLQAALFGNVAERLVGRVPGSVLAVRQREAGAPVPGVARRRRPGRSVAREAVAGLLAARTGGRVAGGYGGGRAGGGGPGESVAGTGATDGGGA